MFCGRNVSSLLSNILRNLVISRTSSTLCTRILVASFCHEKRIFHVGNKAVFFSMGNTRFVLAMIATVAAGTWLYKYFKGDGSRGDRSNYNYNNRYDYYDRYFECEYDDYYDRSRNYYDYAYDDYNWYDDNINYAHDISVNNQCVVNTVSQSTNTKVKRKRRKKRKNRKNAVECTICLNSVRDRKKKLLCGHFFHVRCIERWLVQERSCPNCRQRI